ncbi:MAG: DNA replication/repair protein RecF [Pseudomonadota bacterium]
MLRSLRIENFRCIRSASLAFDPHCTVVEGANGAGKTSLLEAIFTLSRGRSFRSRRRDHAISHGESGFLLFGEITRAEVSHRVGLEVSRNERRIRVDGEDRDRIGDLAKLLPVQIIDPTVHGLIDGGPENRRRYVDFGVFHVEQQFLASWSDFRRAVSQRNSALRVGSSDTELDGWDQAVASLSEQLTALRARHVADISNRLPGITDGMLPDAEIDIEFRRGWSADRNLLDVLREHRERDRQSALTQDGAHRADLKIAFRDRAARHQVSRGQQKLLASALILAQVAEIQTRTEQETVVMVDDPAAELDSESLDRLISATFAVPCQRVLTALDASRLRLPVEATMFHVEQGSFRAKST